MIHLFILIFKEMWRCDINMKKEKMVAIISIITLMLFLIGIIPTWIYKHYFTEYENRRWNEVAIDWQKQYPFQVECSNNKISLISRYEQKINAIKEKLEGAVNSNTILRYPLSEIYCSVQKYMGISKITSAEMSVLALNDGYFSYSSDEKIDNIAVANNVKEFQNYLSNCNIDFLYVMAPYKYSETNENNIYRGYADYTKENAEQLNNQLIEKDVNFLNLQQRTIEQGIDTKTLFFKTDHHWKPYAALWGANEIANEMNAKYGFNIDTKLYNSENFEVHIYKNFLGSQGKKTTLAYAKPENFEILTPKYNTKYHITVPSLNLNMEGSFYETLIDKKQLIEEEYPDQCYNANLYGAYGYADKPLITIKNNNIIDNKRVLIIKDSFGSTATPFLSLGLSEISVLDLRLFNGSVKSYIDEYKPDMVLIIMNGGTGKNTVEGYEGHTNMYDFR